MLHYTEIIIILKNMPVNSSFIRTYNPFPRYVKTDIKFYGDC